MFYPAKLLSTTFGLGLLPKAPGTWGSLGGILLLFFFEKNFVSLDGSFQERLRQVFSVTGSIFQLCLCLATYMSVMFTEKDWPHDDSRIVIDETIGQFYVLVFFPITWINVILGFLLFRFFDILKPGPVGFFDRCSGSWSTVVDDLVAAVLAALVLGGINTVM